MSVTIISTHPISLYPGMQRSKFTGCITNFLAENPFQSKEGISLASLK